MHDVEVQPVRRRGRYGVDRGVVVLVTIAAVIGIALLKPWSAAPPASAIPAVGDNNPETAASPAPSLDAGRTPVDVPAAGPVAPVPRPTEVAIDTQSPISLVEARRRAQGTARYDVFSAVVATPSDTQRVKFRDSVPRVTEFGYCDRGALLEAPLEEVAFLTATVPVTSHELVRVFERGDPVSIPAASRETAPDGFVLSVDEDDGLAVGHYAVIMRAYGGVRIVPFCVAEVMRLANGAVARFVPQAASNAAARKALLRDLANIRSE